MDTPVSYSIGELVEASGFDRRTIVFYIQQGILPRVGRRGPSTRYPAECLARLKFVAGVKALQNTGRVLGASLREMAAVLNTTPPADIAALLEKGLPATDVEALFQSRPLAPAAIAPAPAAVLNSPPTPERAAPSLLSGGPRGSYAAPGGEKRSYGLADAGIRRRAGDAPATGAPSEVHDETFPRLPALQPAAVGNAPGAGVANGSIDSADLGELLRQLELKAGMSRRRAGPGASEQWTEIPVTGRVYLSIRGLPDEDAPLAESVVRALKRAMR